jgi:hypothetical protein
MDMEPLLLMPTFDERAVFSHNGEEFVYILEGVHEFIHKKSTY